MLLAVHVPEIFNPGGLPLYTYNPRTNLKLEEQVNAYLKTGNKLLSISGPTKSGKTVLCKKLIPSEERIWISGGEIREEDDFWCKIIAVLGVYNQVCKSHSNSTEESLGSEANAEASALIIKGGGKVTETDTTTNEDSQTFSRTLPPRILATNVLPKQKKTLIIDDFHYINPEIQKNIIRALKTPIFESLRVIIISVSHHANDTEKAESEMAGRVQHLEIPIWTIEELQEIAKIGFKLLNVVHESLITEMLAKESFGSPQLMHEFCAKLCEFNKIEKTSKNPTLLTNYPRTSFFPPVAKTITSSTDFCTMERGPHARTERKIWKFVYGGREGDIYAAILIALANTGPKTTITYEEIRAQLRTVIKGDLPQLNQISNALSHMQMLSSSDKPKVIEWDNSTHTLYIQDPYFAFYLRWLVRVSK